MLQKRLPTVNCQSKLLLTQINILLAMRIPIIYIIACFLAISTHLKAQDASEIKGYYWIDNDVPIEFSGTTFEVPTDKYQDGVHIISVAAYTDDKGLSIPRSTSFTKTSTLGLQGLCLIDSNTQNPLPLTENGDGIYSVDLDANSLSVGLHNLQFMCLNAGGTVSESHGAWFFRAPNEAEYKDAKIVYFLDGKYSGAAPLNSAQNLYLIDIDTKQLNTGIHSIDFLVTLTGGIVSNVQKSWFYKMPIPRGVVQHEYWFDNDYANAVTTTLDEAITDLELIKMINIPDLTFNSKNYAFSITEKHPVINAINTFTMRFTEADGRTALNQSEFINSQIERPIAEIDELTNGLNIIQKPAENDIKLLSFTGEVGDSIALKFDQSLYYELFSPSAKRILQRKGSQSESLTTTTLTENGTFYLAVHDVTSQRDESVYLEFNHVPRIAILEVSPTISTSSTSFTSISIFGNGLLNAKKITLSGGGKTYVNEAPFAYDNYNLSTCFMHDELLANGVYDLTIDFFDPIKNEDVSLIKEKVLTIIKGGKANVKVDVVPSNKASTPYMVEIRIVNDSDVPCWGIPFNIACERNGGKNGFIFYMTDMFANKYSLEQIEYYESDNILGTGVDGLYFPLMLDYLAPHEERCMRVGIISEPHAHVGLYAWTGQPYSEEIPEFTSIPTDSLAKTDLYQTNILSYMNMVYWTYALNEVVENHANSARLRASSSENDWVLEALREYGPDALGKLPGAKDAANLANHAANVALANAHTIGSLVNLGECRKAYEQLKDNGIPGDNLLEQLDYFYKMYPDERESGEWKHRIDLAERSLARLVPPQEIVREALAGYDLNECEEAMIDCMVETAMECSYPMPDRHDIYCMQSNDPNMITGYTDPAGSNFVGIDVKQLEYTIEFENDSTIATAPASTIIVKNNLNKDIFDLTSFAPVSLTIGAHEIKLPKEHNFVITEDMRPDIYCIAEIRQEYSEETGFAQWTFRSLDPLTLEEAENYRQGLLPVNDSTNVGIGTITYSIDILSNLPHLTSIENMATIIFDDNEAIETPTYQNITDYIEPKSSIIKEYGYSNGCYSFDVETSDDGSGVMRYDLYYRKNNSDSWHLILASQTSDHIELTTPEPINGIQFMVKATDCAGNIEAEKGDTSNLSDIEISTQNSDDIIWYNINGTRINNSNNCSVGTVIISNKGNKVIVK